MIANKIKHFIGTKFLGVNQEKNLWHNLFRVLRVKSRLWMKDSMIDNLSNYLYMIDQITIILPSNMSLFKPSIFISSTGIYFSTIDDFCCFYTQLLASTFGTILKNTLVLTTLSKIFTEYKQTKCSYEEFNSEKYGFILDVIGK